MTVTKVYGESGAKVPDTPDETLHACTDGQVFIGHLVEEDGEEVERVIAIPCRRCTDTR